MRRIALIVLVGIACARREDPAARTDSVPAPSRLAPADAPAAQQAAAPAPPPLAPQARDGGVEPAGKGQAFTAGVVEYRPRPREVALLTDVRSARHEGFDRIVFEFATGPLPGYHLEYIDKPVRRCGSGETTVIAGEAWLEVRLDPANAHTPSGAPTIKDRDQELELAVVKELEQTCDFEAHVTWVLGAIKPNKYRVLTLDEPLRLVVDVQH
jgi:hypothetical protein